MWAGSPKFFDDDPAMEMASDDDSAPLRASFHTDLTMEQAHAHFITAMVKEQLES